METEEPFVHLTSKALKADAEGKISEQITGYKSGMVLLSAAYIFGAAGMNEIAAAIIAYGKRLDLPAMRPEHTSEINKIGNSWELIIDGQHYEWFDTLEEAQAAGDFWSGLGNDNRNAPGKD